MDEVYGKSGVEYLYWPLTHRLYDFDTNHKPISKNRPLYCTGTDCLVGPSGLIDRFSSQ